MDKFLQTLQKKLGLIAGVVGSLTVIVGGYMTIRQMDFFPATRGYVEEYVEEYVRNDNEIQDQASLVVLETELQEWTITLINIAQRRAQLQDDIDGLNGLIDKAVNQGNTEDEDYQSLVTLRDRLQSELNDLADQL
jgi:hypothetical protein